MTATPRPRRSLLFAPANRPAIREKALSAGADIVCLDLEDAVPPQDKVMARAEAMSFLVDMPGPERTVRINSVRSREGLSDLLAMAAAAPRGGTIVLPKVADPFELRLVDEILTEAGLGLSLAVLIESAEGLEKAPQILSASPRLQWVLFGAVDYAAEMGLTVAHEPLLYARQRLVHAARLAGVDILDVPCLSFRDEGAVAAEADMARLLGFDGKAALHPSNIAVLNRAFSPTPEQVDRARAIISAFQAAPNGLAVLDGKLVEKPVVLAATKILAAQAALSNDRGQDGSERR